MATLQDTLPLLLKAEPKMIDRIHSELTQQLSAPKAANIEVATITYAEAAKRLGVGRATIGRLVQKGVFKIVQLPTRTRINLQSFNEYAKGYSVFTPRA